MRLLEFKHDDEFSLTDDLISNIPPYAILSHTWGEDTNEVSFRDLMDGLGKSKAGYDKIRFCGEQARRDQIQYFWVDTCCIDKSSSAELQEAINSMFHWYRNAARCYVYLSDVSTNNHVDPSLQSWHSAFRKSRWFTRGWTLQELIAPLSVEFFCSNGNLLGNKKSLERQLYEITRIAIPALQGTPLSTFSFRERMEWAKNRQTKRKEDKAYSLLGIFDIHMSLIYGEGMNKALSRLEEEISKQQIKRLHDELSTVPHSNSTKTLKTPPHSQLSSVPSRRDPNFLNSKPLLCSEYSLHHDNPPENQKQPVAIANHVIDDTTKQALIDQLYFTKIDERLTSLTAAQGTTCRWFLTKPEYRSWHNVAQQPDHGGFLWIQGNPGTGKSTLMKLLFEETKLNVKGDSLQIILSFFFLARGTVEEKSTIGLYRSLLHQLFEKVVELKECLEWMTADGARVVQRSGWHEEALKQTLTHIIKQLGSRPLMIFIDALDECDDNQATGMVSFFEELCDIAREAHVQLQICFSSRHYPTIVIQKGIRVTLEDEIGHTEDIEQYIKSKLKVGKMKEVETLRSKILEKSSRIFLWVVLVVEILNSEYRNGSASTRIREHLKEIPPGLTELFEMILTRDRENLKQLQVCLKWILFATRPLKPQELYFAIQLGLNKKSSSYWDQEDIELEQIETFVRSSSKGLAEVTWNRASEVQFIHESVRDFLLSKYEGQWSRDSSNFIGHSHEILRGCCLAQLKASINQDVDILNPLLQALKAIQLQKTIRLKFPFLEYSILNILHHANSAQYNQMGQGDFLTDFPLRQWIFLNNILENFDIPRYTESASLLYILAEKNLASLIRIHPQRELCFDIENERYGLPIFASLATGSHEAVQTFLDIQAERQPQEPLLRHLCKQYSSENRNKRSNFGDNFTFSQQRSVFAQVAEQGCKVIFTFLCASGKLDVESKDKFDRTPLLYAASNDHVAAVKLLLEKGGDLESKDRSGQTPLLVAALNGHEAVVKLLLEKGAYIESKGISGWTPLFYAAQNGHEAVVKLLLDKGADLESKDSSGWTPLLYAARKGDEAAVRLLLEKGADLESEGGINSWQIEKGANFESKDNSGWTPLLFAALNGHEAVVKLLVEKGANLESRDKSGRTPLFNAAEKGHKAVVELLDEKGANFESKDNSGRTPLLYAAKKGHEAMAKLLVEKGVNLESRDRSGRTPLLNAAEKGHKAVVKLLAEKGANLESKDNGGRIPLLYAALNGHEAVVKLLVKKGANLESKDKRGRTLLLYAAEKGHRAVVKLLLEEGADLESKDNSGRTPLSWAAMYGNREVVWLLLEKGADLESRDKIGRTPLSRATEMGHEAVVRLLREAGK